MTSFAKFWTLAMIAGLVGAGTVRAETAKKAAIASQKGQTCPIAMVAEQEAGIIASQKLQMPRKAPKPVPAHGIHFTFTNQKLGTVAALRLRVNGWNSGAHRVPLRGTDARQVRGWKMVDVKVNIGPRKTGQADVLVRGLNSVNSIDLMSVHYADGSKWKAANASACSVAPDPAMLISQK